MKEFESLLSDDFSFIKNNKKYEVANIPCSFDIEVSSFYEGEEKRAIMYCWVLGINGKCVIGRTWEQFMECMKLVVNKYQLNPNRRMIFYIHNLAYEWQFIRKRFDWENVFALDKRKVLYALTQNGIEFRCSYLLSGYSLEKTCEHLTKYRVEKMVGDLDYNKLRHSGTYLYKKEKNYVLYDGLGVMCYIQEMIESHHNNINYLPLTNTGEVRDFLRRKTIYRGKHHTKSYESQNYRELIQSIRVNSLEEYEQLKRAFHGGFTHANPLFTNHIVDNITSYDFSSSYPSVMVMEKYPMSSAKLVQIHSKDEFNDYLKTYCCLFDVQFKNIRSRTPYEHMISESKCFELVHPSIDNGRVVDAEVLSMTMNEVDYETYSKFYEWDSMKINNFRIYLKRYLPREFVMAILELYQKKTTLKDVEDMYAEYMHSKGMINSCYGCCVTDILRDSLVYDSNDLDDGGWKVEEREKQVELDRYNNSPRRFLAYQWGIWVTSYAMRNLATGIYACGRDYVYSDTDSIKCQNMESHMDYINSYNQKVMMKLELAMSYQNLPIEMCSPKTIKGKTKTIGVWDYDGFYEKFSTLGAKRYFVKTTEPIKYGNELIPYSLTISGLSKFTAIPYLYHLHGDDIMKSFKDGMFIPRDYTGKKLHSYIDDEITGVVVDYRGKRRKYHELSSIHMENCEYELSLSRDYLDFLLQMEDFIE